MQRETVIEGKYQMTIGEIMEKIKYGGLTYGDDNQPKVVQFDFGTAVPTDVDSWRGSYDCPQIGYRLTGYDSDSDKDSITAEQFLKELELGISGRVYTGWKGGDFTYSEDDGLWVSNSGNASGTVIIDVINDGWRYLIVTAYCEY